MNIINGKSRLLFTIWLALTVLIYLPFANAEHIADHDFSTENVHCHICTLAHVDSLEASNLSIFTAPTFINHQEKYEPTSNFFNSIALLPDARAPPSYIQ